MFRKEVLILCGVALAVFALVVGAASLAIRAAQHDAKMLAEDTLPGLVNAGEAINRIHENWFNTRLLLNLDSTRVRSNLINGIVTNSTGILWQRYSESIFDAQDAASFTQMETSRANFLQSRGRYFDLVGADKMDEARTCYDSQLTPAFQKYRDSAADFVALNATVGQRRAGRIIHMASWTPSAL